MYVIGSALPLPHPAIPRSVGTIFLKKKLCMGETKFSEKFIGRQFTWGIMTSKVQPSSVSLSLTLTYIINILFEKLTPQIGH